EFIYPSLSTHDKEETRDEESFDPIPKILENTDDEGNGEENLGMNVGREDEQDEEEEEDEIQRRAVSSILGIVQRYMDQRMNETVKVAVQIQSDRLRDEAQAENDEFLKTIDENMQKIIKEQVKEQVKRNLYNALAKAYESDKIILETYGNTVTWKRRRDDDADKDEEPSAGSNRGSKRGREGKEPESASAPNEKATRSTGKSTQVSKSQQTLASESAIAEEPMQTTFEIEEPSHPEFETGADDQPIVEPSQCRKHINDDPVASGAQT
nr:hypothetical protein [Tanacetum cinerariifolium]